MTTLQGLGRWIARLRMSTARQAALAEKPRVGGGAGFAKIRRRRLLLWATEAMFCQGSSCQLLLSTTSA